LFPNVTSLEISYPSFFQLNFTVFFLGFIFGYLYAYMQFIFCLRDTTLPKFVCEDVPLFLGLTRDLFPGLECPLVGYPNFEAAVETALAEEGYVVLPAQVSCKRSQLTGNRGQHA
jgi:hypothetical protein